MPTTGFLWDAHHTFVAGEGVAGGDLRAARPLRPAHAPQGLAAGREAGERTLRAHRGGRGAGARAGARARRGRLPRLLRFRVGEELAPGDRGAGGRLPALREGHGGIPQGFRSRV